MYVFGRFAAILLIGIAVLLPLSAAEHPTGAIGVSDSNIGLVADQYPWPHNGCTSSPNNIGVADFTYPCNHHDGCYAEHWAPRATCDQWFMNDMMAECDKIVWPRGIPSMFDPVRTCRSTAGIYHTAVRLLGEKYYNSSGKYVRIDTPMKVG